MKKVCEACRAQFSLRRRAVSSECYFSSRDRNDIGNKNNEHYNSQLDIDADLIANEKEGGLGFGLTIAVCTGENYFPVVAPQGPATTSPTALHGHQRVDGQCLRCYLKGNTGCGRCAFL